MPRKTLVLVFATVLALAACAPMGGPDRRGDMEGGPAGNGGGPVGGGGAGMVVANLQQQLQQTAEALKLTPTQAVLWDHYQDKVGALMADQMKLPPYRASRQPAPQQIAQKVDIVRNRLAAMEEIQEAAGKLYAALDSQQKATADQMLPTTVPALYSGQGGSSGGERGGERTAGRGSPGGGGISGPGGGMGGPGGGFGGGFGR